MSEKYFDKFALSQSSLKDWKELCPKDWFEKWILRTTPRRTSSSLEFGNLLDTLCFNPELFDKRFILADIAKPSDSIVKVVTDTYNHLLQLNSNIDKLNEQNKDVVIPHKIMSLKDNKEIVQKFCVENEYYATKLEQGYNTAVRDGSAYFDFLSKVGKKIVITELQKKAAEDLKEILFNDPVSAPFFVPSKGCEVYFQVQIFAEFELTGFETLESLPMKCMIDIIHVNNKRKEVREVDLKFTSDTFKFNDYKGPVRMFDYPTQHSVYDYMLPFWLETFKEGKYKEYTICNPLNVVIDDNHRLPLLYEYNKHDLYIKRFGIEGTSFRGWEDIVNEIAWHMDNSDWTRPREHVKNGRLFINLYKK